jgi:hypothetical protein
VTQNGDSRVLIQLIDDDLLDHFCGDGVALAISCSLGDDYDVQALASRTFLNLSKNEQKY